MRVLAPAITLTLLIASSACDGVSDGSERGAEGVSQASDPWDTDVDGRARKVSKKCVEEIDRLHGISSNFMHYPSYDVSKHLHDELVSEYDPVFIDANCPPELATKLAEEVDQFRLALDTWSDCDGGDCKDEVRPLLIEGVSRHYSVDERIRLIEARGRLADREDAEAD